MKFIIFTFTIFLSLNNSFADKRTGLSIINEDELTEAEQKEADEYIHQGLADKKVSELCDGNDGKNGYNDVCDEKEKAFKTGKFMSKLEPMIPIVDKAMAVIGISSEITSTTTGADGKSVTENETDWCSKIAMMSEIASSLLVKGEGDTAEKNYQSAKPEAKQAASFRSLAANQKSMAKASNIQFGVWTATAACYTAYLAQPQYGGKGLVAKLAGSVFMGTFYKLKADAHKDREKLLKNMANKLPQAGECSPFDDKSCFCAEESSFKSDPKNFNKFCVPKELVARNQNNDASVCVDQQGKADKKCKCKKTKTCIDRRLKIAGVNLGLNPTKLRDPLAALKPLSDGFGSNSFNSAANRNMALAKKALKKYQPDSKISLNPSQKKLAQSLYKNGIPKAAAAVMAKAAGNSTGAKAPSSATAGLFGDGGYGKYKKSKRSTSVTRPRFVKGRGGRKAKRSRNRGSRFGRRKAKRNTKGVYIEEFADAATKKANREAEISKDTSRGIFEIISYRYKLKAKKVPGSNWGL